MAVIIFGLFLGLGILAPPKAIAAGAEKVSKAKRIETLASKGAVTYLTDSNFTRFAESGQAERPYHLVLLFTTFDPNLKCPTCKVTAEAMATVAHAYRQQHDFRTAGDPIVFALVLFEDNKNTFYLHGMASAPHAYLVPKGENLPAGSEKDDMELKDVFPVNLDYSFPEAFAQSVSRGTGVQIILARDTSRLFPSALLIGLFVGVVAHFFANVPGRVVAALRYRGIWMTASMACYMTGVGGMIYCIIRNPETCRDKKHELEMFSRGGRDQYWYEGVVVACLYVIMSTAILGTYSAASWKRVPSPVRGVAMLACVTILCYIANLYLTLYMKKTQWYSMAGLLTSHVAGLHKPPLRRDHGILKRVVRLSHLWLNEFTTLEAFGEKVKKVLLDYLVRMAKSFYNGGGKGGTA